MAVLTLHDHKNNRIFHAKKGFLTEEAAKARYKFYLTDYLHKIDSGHINSYYQLHTKDYYHINDTMQFDIRCPQCTNYLKVYKLFSDGHTHSWYHCPRCNK